MKTLLRSFFAVAFISGIAVAQQPPTAALSQAERAQLRSQLAALEAERAALARGEGAAPARPTSAAPTRFTTSATDPGFDIINKTNLPITIHVTNGDTPVVRKAVVIPSISVLGKTLKSNNFSKQIDINRPTLLAVWTKPLTNKETDFLTTRVGSPYGTGSERFFENWTIWPKPNYVYHFTPGKSIYVTLDKNGEMRPQTGPKGGTTGKTEAGYPLENKVEQKDIFRYKGSIGERGNLEAAK